MFMPACSAMFYLKLEEIMMDTKKGHSEEYFKDYRDYWWNADFLELMAKRWELSRCSTLLDVGAGQCHWSRLLAPHLKSPRKVTAVDRDEKWSKGSPEIVKLFNAIDTEVEFRCGDACALPFPDDTFDVVTCQTVLIHIADPLKALSEMKRVMKKGGILITAEPQNLSGWVMNGSTLTRDEPVEAALDRVRYGLTYERGKRMLGQGDNSLGDHMPGLFARAGMQDIRVYLSDKASPLFPPYESEEQKAILRTYREWQAEGSGSCDREQALQYFRAYGEDEENLAFFEREFDTMQRENEALIQAADAGHFSMGGAVITYLVSGTK